MINEEKATMKSSPLTAIDLSEVENLLTNPLSMVMAMQDATDTALQSKRPLRFPDVMKRPSKDFEILKARIKEYWTLRQMILQLTEDYQMSAQLMKVNPMLSSNSLVDGWIEG